MSDPKPKRDPSALTSEYHKARKQLMLWAGILLIWELVGVDLERAKEADGNFSALVKAIKSPQAVPWVLLILVAYFLFKVTVEWYQCNEARRNMRVARIDFTSAWVVSLLAYVLYFAQAISHVQFADLLQDFNKWPSLATGFISGVMFAKAATEVLYFSGQKYAPLISWKTFLTYLLVGTFPLLLFVSFTRLKEEYVNWRYLIMGMALPFAVIVIPREIRRGLSRLSGRKTRAWDED